jgi:hypothetical protein
MSATLGPPSRDSGSTGLPVGGPRHLVERLEAAPPLPPGSEDRFNGYGVMGLPFTSGHILALRRFPASSVGPGYTSVWHRDPGGAWTFYANAEPRFACTRFFGAAVSQAIETDITIAWPGPYRLRIEIRTVPLEWDVTIGPTPATRFMNALGRLLPRAAWRSPTMLQTMSIVAGRVLNAGRVGLQGTAPNGQRFIANPRVLWAILESRAALRGEDLGPPGPVAPQAHLGDFWIPQRGILALGQTYFDPFDPTRHSSIMGAPQTSLSPSNRSLQ